MNTFNLALSLEMSAQVKNMADIGASDIRILRLKKLSERIGLSRSTIYDRMNPRSPRYDESFPRPIYLGGAAIGWVQDDIDAWLRNRIELSKNII
ncbi:helix-turn-helix transcriptional regulator [Pseudomonas sp. Gutcm_11s]|uniref:helix-turn-helix transcriptional regulator n=1 Tax=Pseudomonas sp. Gutcm_11s TaxID=3026088 RepID=UPI002361660C|nr:AlpA family phage regulatory protein [Pseudomonas sp. Gutcm_11s]MDD0841159.1 AlpA family phage regulatory protein [Pseudomonas sp. Gutcm_11s]